MARWLFKEEPDQYNFADLVRDGKTLWNGVSNNAALLHLRSVRTGDEVFFYHTGKEKAVVGVMRAVSDPKPDPEAANEKLVAVDVEPIRPLARPVTLAEIKASKALAAWVMIWCGFASSLLP